ncbi:MAG: hypothetical protein WCK39_07365 [Methanomassiliicoccales archaeon]
MAFKYAVANSRAVSTMDEEIIVIQDLQPPRGLGWRISLTVLLGIGWLAFIIIWLFFYAGKFYLHQNIAVFILSVVVAIGLASIVWISFGLRMARLGGGYTATGEARNWIGWRGIVSTLIWVGWLAWLIIWLYSYWPSLDIYQNIALFLVSLLLAGGLSWALNASRFRRYGQ